MEHTKGKNAATLTKLPLFVLLIFICVDLHSQLTPRSIDSLELVLNTETDPKARVDLLNELSILYYRVSLIKEQEYANQALKLSQDINYLKGETMALKNIGVAKRKLGAPLDTVLYYYNSSLAIAQENEFIEIKIALLNNIALALSEHQQYHQALNHLLRCIDLDEANMPLSWKRPIILANIANLYFNLEDYEKALSFYNRSYKIALDNGYDHINLMHVDDLAMTKYKLGDKQDAQKLIVESLDLIRQEGDFESLYQATIVLIDIKFEEKELIEARDLGLNMIKELNLNDFPLYRCQAYYKLADIEIQLKNIDAALDYSLKSSKCADNNGSGTIRIEALQRLYEVYNLSNNFTKKDSIYYQYIDLAEKEIERKLDLAIGEEDAKFQNLLKEREIALLKEDQIVSNRQKNLLLGGLIVFLILSLTSYYLFIKRNKLAIKLTSKNNALQKAEKKLGEKNEILEKYIKSNIQLSQFAHIASHDLKSPLRTVSSFVGLTMRSAKDRLKKEEIEYMNLSLEASKSMYQLVDDLLTYSKVNALNLEIEKIDIKMLLLEVQKNLTFSINENNAEIKVKCDVPFVYGDRIKLRQVLENLISNSLKFVDTGEQPFVEIRCQESEKDWLYEVKDNGIGIDSSFITQAFEPFKQLNIKDEFSGTGLGLSLCKQIIEKHDGTIWIESVKGKGTSVFFTLSKSLSPNNI